MHHFLMCVRQSSDTLDEGHGVAEVGKGKGGLWLQVCRGWGCFGSLTCLLRDQHPHLLHFLVSYLLQQRKRNNTVT